MAGDGRWFSFEKRQKAKKTGSLLIHEYHWGFGRALILLSNLGFGRTRRLLEFS